ncbi:IS3 family transposase [Veillonella fallax]|uniref:Integrase core domain-containing protein n=1 Tax=Veillonella fallax TaxID=2881272 RepID=A0ABS8F187_9FIRM|nr:integrase core domain-containing protein [Veillonella fallax]
MLLTNYIDDYNIKYINIKLKGMNPVEYRTHSQRAA